MKRYRWLAPLIAVLAVLLAFAGGAAAAPSAATVPVSAADFQFSPRTVTVNVGDTVVWTNTGAVAHTVTASNGSWDSGLFGPGQTFSRTFTTAGTFNYYCIPHGTPAGGGMAGVVIVQAAQAAPAPAAPAAPAPAPQPGAPAAPAPAPGTLPSTGDAGVSSDLWLVVTLAAFVLMAGGLVMRERAKTR